ncbi:MAG TPA: GMC family oxidoreductase [Phycisphaerae bacterium]|nr:GMC family oxidoreductase [Phycisphaerae bacterium]
MLVSEVSSLPNGASASSRIVIIGSGAIGLYAASLLAMRGRNVLVIESGDRHLGTFAAESYVSVGRPHRGISLGRSRSLGGTTNLWGGQLVEFQPIDFNGRDWLPGSKWPVGYDEIAPYYARTYENLAIPAAMQHDEGVWRGISSDCPQLGNDFEVFLTRWLRTPGTAVMFARQIESDKKMCVFTGCTAVGFRGEGGRIQAVKVLEKTGKSHWIDGDVFILAAGTIENSRLLLHTAQDPQWECPWRANKTIGQFFQDHPVCKIGVVEPTDKRTFFNMFSTIVLKGYKFQPKIRFRNEVLAQRRILNVQGFFMFEGKVSEHLVYLKQFLKAAIFSRKLSGTGDLFRNFIGSIRFLVPLMWRYVKDHRIFVPGSANIGLGIQAEQAPCADSRITIDGSSLDVYGLPRVVLDWRINEHDLESIREFAIQIRDAMQSAGIGRLEIDEDLLNRNPKFLSNLRDNYHQIGGTVMGFSEQHGVVDKNLRVFGTTNFYVGGASIFRTSSNANPTFTAMAFATRLVDHLTGSGTDKANQSQD